MASIRRTLSPSLSASASSSSSSASSNGHDHDHLLPQTQKSPYLSSSSNYCPSSPFRRLLMSVLGRLLSFRSPSPSSSRKSWGAHHHHHLWYYHWHRNWNWKRSFLRFFLFFLLGFLLGFSPFAHLHDLKPHHFFFDSIASSSSASASNKPIIDDDNNSNNDNIIISINNPHPLTNLVLVRPTKSVIEMETTKPVELPKSNTDNNPTEKEEEEMNPAAADPDHHLLVPPAELNLKLLIVVTPTYNRALQAYYLNRLGQTLRLVPPPLLWIVVEMKSASMETAHILRTTGVMYRHLVCDDSGNSNNIKDRGVHQRNTALDHIQRHSLDGIVYFADDDNIYSLDLFHQLRNVRRFGTWPVAMLAQNKNKATLEGPVCNGSQVIGWHTNEKSKRVRRFHVDMSGFAFNSTILWDPKRWRLPTSHAIRQLDTVKEGFQETTFIEQVVEDESQMEGIHHGCSKIMNWHLHLEARQLYYPKGWQVSRDLDAVSSLG